MSNNIKKKKTPINLIINIGITIFSVLMLFIYLYMIETNVSYRRGGSILYLLTLIFILIKHKRYSWFLGLIWAFYSIYDFLFFGIKSSNIEPTQVLFLSLGYLFEQLNIPLKITLFWTPLIFDIFILVYLLIPKTRKFYNMT